MQEEKNKDSRAYPQRTQSDEQLKNQDEFVTQKPNEKSSTNSDIPQPVTQGPNSTAPGDENYREAAGDRNA